MRDQRPGVDYTNLYFGFIIWRAVIRVLGACLFVVFIAAYFILSAIFPDAGSALIIWMLGGLIGLVVLFVLYAATRKPRTMADVERSLGWTPNPPAGVSWFRDNGEKKAYDKATGTWS